VPGVSGQVLHEARGTSPPRWTGHTSPRCLTGEVCLSRETNQDNADKEWQMGVACGAVVGPIWP
jgi:hypothetical protein